MKTKQSDWFLPPTQRSCLCSHGAACCGDRTSRPHRCGFWPKPRDLRRAQMTPAAPGCWEWECRLECRRVPHRASPPWVWWSPARCCCCCCCCEGGGGGGWSRCGGVRDGDGCCLGGKGWVKARGTCWWCRHQRHLLGCRRHLHRRTPNREDQPLCRTCRLPVHCHLQRKHMEKIVKDRFYN